MEAAQEGEGPAPRHDARSDGHSAHPRRDRSRDEAQTSVLFEHVRAPERNQAPACFADLNLDQVVETITAGREEYDLKPLFHTPLDDAAGIYYRQEVMRDCERDVIAQAVESFAERMRRVRGELRYVGKLYYKRQREAWFLEAVATYCEAVEGLADDLLRGQPASRGLRAICDYLASYVRSSGFSTLSAQTAKLKRGLSGVRYSMTIKASSIRVSGLAGEADYGAEVERTFERFRLGEVKDHRARFATLREMGHVEAAVLEFVARVHPELFAQLADYCERHREFTDETLARFDREIQFYAAYRAYIQPLQSSGLKLCYPQVSPDSKEVCARETFDLALARKLADEHGEVVCNDWQLSGRERIFVVSGPNQGGKTTFARTFGQLHYLARLGCPVPGTQARVLLCDELLTHFERQEDLSNHHGKLKYDLIRVHEILQRASARSVIVMNESFTSTTLDDARFLGTEVLRRMIALDVLGVYVTFVDELASLDESVVSATSVVAEEDPTIRTYKIVRRPADGLAYAAAIAEKYRLTYDVLRERVAS